MQYKSYKTAATFTWSVSGLRHIFRSFTTWLIVSECLKVRVLCANHRWVQESRDQSNHRQVFGAASCLQPISPSNNQDSPGTTQKPVGEHTFVTNEQWLCCTQHGGQLSRDFKYVHLKSHEKPVSPPQEDEGRKKKNTQMQANIFLIVVLLQFCDNSKKC